ncbi:MAG: hypothetical protein DSY40_01380 [Nautilia sp.]|nr:MAG: hypothetical protein DSY40_01380 [Nautilia sp.]
MMNEKKDLMGDITKDENSMKKYLLIGGGIFTIFVIGIVLSKFIFSSSSNDSTKVILPPEPTTINKKNDDTTLFNSIPIEKENDNLANDNKEEETIKKINSKPTTEEIEKENKEVVKVPEKKDEVKEQPISKEVVKPQKKIEDVKQKVEKRVEKEVKPKPIQNKKVIRNYYLQVAAVTRGKVSKDFLKLINKNGFNYKIIEVNLNGREIKRVLIGPFTKSEAKEALPKVKNKISSSAFIKRIK